MVLIHTHVIESNTFKFYVTLGPVTQTGKYNAKVKVEQITDFTGTVLAADYPNGSTSKWTCTVEVNNEKHAVNLIASKLLAVWTNI